MPSEYQPESRRPIADLFRLTAHAAVRLAVRWGIHPDAISSASVVAAGGAAACLIFARDHTWLLLLAPLGMVLRLWLNMLDGMVALAAGKASPRGELFNELPDRISDFVLFSGLAHSGFAIGGLAYWAGGAALFVAYVGTFGQALGVGRQFGGVMSKQWRMVALCVGCLFAFAVGDRTGSWAGLAVFDWCLIAVLLGCVQTVWVRLGAIVRGLDLAQNSTGASGS